MPSDSNIGNSAPDNVDNLDFFEVHNRRRYSRRKEETFPELSKGITLENLGRKKDLVTAHNSSEDKLLASINL